MQIFLQLSCILLPIPLLWKGWWFWLGSYQDELKNSKKSNIDSYNKKGGIRYVYTTQNEKFFQKKQKILKKSKIFTY
jgi:hypothetical protein